MSKMNELYLAESEAHIDAYIEAQREELREEGRQEMRNEVLRLINVEKSWNNQSEGFRGALDWMEDKLNGVPRI